MTNEQLQTWAHGKYRFPSLTMSVAERDAYELTQYALALSAKLEEAQAEIARQAECERAMIGAVHSWSRRAEFAEDKLARLKVSSASRLSLE